MDIQSVGSITMRVAVIRMFQPLAIPKLNELMTPHDEMTNIYSVYKLGSLCGSLLGG